MPHVVVHCREKDIRRVKITCRCGTVSIAEFPQQIARALNLHPCPGCQAGYVISQASDGKWRIERATETIEGKTFQSVEPPKKVVN